MIAFAWNPSTLETQVQVRESPPVSGQSRLCSKFQASLGYKMSPCLKHTNSLLEFANSKFSVHLSPLSEFLRLSPGELVEALHLGPAPQLVGRTR